MLALRLPVLAMITGAAAVVLGGPAAGWVSGTLANTASGATATMVFDLGPDWAQYGSATIVLQANQAVASINAYSSDDGAANTAPAVTLQGAAAAGSLAGAGVAVFAVYVGARYLRLVCVNGATAQTAAAGARVNAFPS